MNNLLVKNLNVTIEDKLILKDINFTLKSNDILAVVGPNGAGKSTLLKTIMRHYATKIDSGTIYYNQKIINHLTTDEVAKLNIYYMHQNPVEIDGVPMIEFLKNIINVKRATPIEIMEMFKLVKQESALIDFNPELLKRSVNVGFSGGERKKNEILQMLLLNPDCILIDEIDSGLDTNTLDKILKILSKLTNKIMIIISHQNKIFDILKPNKVIVLNNGQIVESGDYKIIEKIKTNGYGQFTTTQANDRLFNEITNPHHGRK